MIPKDTPGAGSPPLAPTPQRSIGLETANDRFKRGFGGRMWKSVIAAALAHFVVFAFFPRMQAQGTQLSESSMEALVIPPEVIIPPPPEQVARPAMPVVGDVDIDPDVTIADNTFDAIRPRDLAPPSTTSRARDIATAPQLIPYETGPQLVNVAEIRRELERRYPSLLRNAGIGGSVLVWFFVDAEGNVANQLLKVSSGYDTMDAVALEIATMMKFRPATNHDVPVAVWVQIPIDFRPGG